ncbi:MAG: hypothetical protein DLM73_10175 [Chthoniobacterales bacterium]|nr:MAG: hypothetical protein DLM73_10175 [Chthoniobacterales bacterium]
MSARDELLRKCLDYFLKHGVANLSLRPLAAAAGTSARMLIHHFGSKEGLIAAVMDQVRARLQSSFEPLITDASKRKPGEIMLGFWKVVTSRKYRPYLRLLFEVQILALQNPRRYQRYLIDTSATWLRLIRRALPRDKSNAVMATLCLAVVDGLTLEYLATGNLSRTSKAIDIFLTLLRKQK